MEQVDGSETSACKNQTPGIHPKDYSQEEKYLERYGLVEGTPTRLHGVTLH
jgi:hypothetical protein